MISQRIERIRQQLNRGEALLVTGIPNRRYLTGFESSDGMVLITPDAAYFLIDFRYVEKARAVVTSCEVRLSQRSRAEIKELAVRHGVQTLFIETGAMSVAEKRGFDEALSGITVSSDDKMDRLLETMRSVKSEEELRCLKEAQRLTDETFSYILDRIAVGRTERDVMLDMEFYMRRRGSEGVSFDFIVVSGKNSSLPHGVPTDKPIAAGDFVTMDFGAVVGGYHADMTRTVAIGAVTDEQRRVYDTVLDAQRAAIAAIREGVDCFDVDKIARDRIDAAGYAGCFGHGLGHSVGLEIHENPCFNTRCHTKLLSGTVMTVEPGIYLENRFGVRIEDMVVVTANGCENLTASRKDLILL